ADAVPGKRRNTPSEAGVGVRPWAEERRIGRILGCLLAILGGAAGGTAAQESSAGGPMTYALARKANYVPLETLRETGSRIPAALARRVSINPDAGPPQQGPPDDPNQAALGA